MSPSICITPLRSLRSEVGTTMSFRWLDIMRRRPGTIPDHFGAGFLGRAGIDAHQARVDAAVDQLSAVTSLSIRPSAGAALPVKGANRRSTSNTPLLSSCQSVFVSANIRTFSKVASIKAREHYINKKAPGWGALCGWGRRLLVPGAAGLNLPLAHYLEKLRCGRGWCGRRSKRRS